MWKLPGTLTIAGEREEVLKPLWSTPSRRNGHPGSEELRSGIESALQPEHTAAV